MSGSPTYAYVALIDVLGYKKYLERDYQVGYLTFQHRLRNALNILTDINEAIYQYQAISDTIIIICSDRNKFIDFIKLQQKLFISFLNENLLIRGGISYSHHFHSGNLTYSHAISLSHKLESSVAIYPRIVVDHNVIELQKELNTKIEKGLLLIHNGIYFIDFISQMGWKNAYNKLKQIYDEEKEIIYRDETIFMKHYWLYHLLNNHELRQDDIEPYISLPKQYEINTK
ncbi:hypothetical protein DBT_0458 [Dissulfuribacter thermophilus]|uniref:Guanylate cyclase domain-containing protein n=1 Tax=Dissulfuribacter thermophilus TaxID=1156395 RepID=A0A1B9F7V7_9BACT|nr:hypothetical protein [Dissulfuribacter thermophilus]OCC15996.1 hypothetical protein DBT_0458 [Dissulfuribacter thermophilus]